MQENVYRSRIASVNELEKRLIDERRRFHQSIVDAATVASCAVVSARLCPWRRAHFEHPSIKFQLFCYVSTKSY